MCLACWPAKEERKIRGKRARQTKAAHTLSAKENDNGSDDFTHYDNDMETKL